MKKNYKYLKLEAHEGICNLFFNRPDKMNALNDEMQKEISEALHDAENDPTIRVIIMSGVGRAFIAGADISVMADQTSLQYRTYARWYHDIREQMLGMSKPIIGAVNGYAYGGGAVVAFAVDLLVAAEGARFGQQEINVGHLKGAAYLPRLVGRLRAAQIVMLGEPITAQEAYRMGLVNWVVPDDTLMEKATEIARKLMDKSPNALMMAKQILRIQNDSPESVADYYELEVNSLCFGTAEQVESMKAFVEKRKPDFQLRKK
ncbi:MAG: enoyl-CoA hydratase/isomerase family protein [Syntrophales bacterium]|jgi:enoyl-CoA hydratase|nr:enoyl-CoA hydratase/isomerase family protein [Syntrophales bacterium]MDY0044110.1 enoyl-CoA hydratase/isomerase family protein [Syntrophales bacterium]